MEWPWFFNQERAEAYMERRQESRRQRQDRDITFADGTAVVWPSVIALSKERDTSSSRRNWMEYERQLSDRDSSDSEDGTVCNPRSSSTLPLRRLRTHIDYDNSL